MGAARPAVKPWASSRTSSSIFIHMARSRRIATKENKMTILRSAVYCLAATIVLTSCIFREPDDLTVDRVEVTSSRDAAIRPVGRSPDGPEDMLTIDVVTRKDLVRLAGSYSVPVVFGMKFCGLSAVGVSELPYPDRIMDRILDEGSNSRGSKDFNGAYHYSISVHMSDAARPSTYRPSYDLRVHPRDICIDTWGGNETGFGYHSNDAVASREQIIAAVVVDHNMR